MAATPARKRRVRGGRPVAAPPVSVAGAYPDRGDSTELHLVMDNYAAHKRVEIRDWLAANPRIHFHLTPTSGSWLNLVEVWFGIIERQAIRRGTFRSVHDLNTKIRAFVNGWNHRKHPSIWTRSADEVLAKINRKTTSAPSHQEGPKWQSQAGART